MSMAFKSEKAPQFSLPFSHGVVAGDFVYVSGQVGVIPETMKVAGETVEEQTKQCLRNLETILESVGLTMEHVIKMSAIISKVEDIPAYNQAYHEVIKEPHPARTTMQGGLGGYLVEIDCVAYTKSRRSNKS